MTQTVTFKQSYRCKTESNFFVTFTIVAAILCGITFTVNFSNVTAQEVGTPTKTSKIWDDWQKIQNETDAGKLNRLVSEIKDRIAPPHEKSVPSIEIKCKVEPTLAIFSPDGKKIATTYIDNTIQMSDADSGKILFDFEEEHQFTIDSIVFSSSGKKIIVASVLFRPFTVYQNVIDIENGTKIRFVESESSNMESFDSVYYGSNNTIVATKANTIQIYDIESADSINDLRPIETLEILPEETPFIEHSQVSLIGKCIAVEYNGGRVRMWRIMPKEPGYVIGGEEYKIDLFTNPTVNINFGVFDNAFSPDGEKFITVEDSNIVMCREVKSGEVLWTLPEGLSEIRGALFSTDGKKIVVVNNRNLVKVLNMDNGKILQTLAGHDKYVTGVLFSPDSKRIVTTGNDDTLKIWDVETGNQVGDTIGGHLNAVMTYEFSSDGKKIVICGLDNTALILDAVTGKKLHVLRGHTSGVTSAMFSQDGKKVVTTSKDDTVRIWTLP